MRKVISLLMLLSAPACGDLLWVDQATEQGKPQASLLLNPDSPEMNRKAPDHFNVRLETSKGPIVLEIHRDWSPLGVDRFYNLTSAGFYDDARFFRVVKGKWAQFGIPADPKVAQAWRNRTLKDEPRKQSNTRGTIAYAFAVPSGRTTQIFFNLKDNSATHDKEPFTPFGKVIEGMDVMDSLYADYGEQSGGGIRGGKQDKLFSEGNAFLKREFPKLDYIEKAKIVVPGPGQDKKDAKPSLHAKAAIEAATWIRSTAIQTDKGKAWPAVPGDPKTVSRGLYNGVSGIVLFFLEAYASTKDEAYLKDAHAGADYLLNHVEVEKQNGLYEGLAGIGFALQETYKSTGDDRYRDGAKRCVQLLAQRARKTGAGVEWGPVTDIISGSAGTGLFLLYAAREWKDDAARDLAAAAGLRLIEQGRPEAGGLKWALSPTNQRLMPNFSHGTAGIAYFLATLYLETKDKRFLDAALAGGKYLKAVAKTEGDVCLVFHHEPGDKDLYYLGWCHGPTGTARLFYQLYKATDDPDWLDWVKRCGRAILQSGIPQQRTPGFWNNVSICCGSAGVAEFCLEMHSITNDRQYLALSKQLTADLVDRGTRDAKGLRWVQAEHRVQPDLLLAQTAYMQGAAGIGMWLFHLDAFERGLQGRIVFPDNPFGNMRVKQNR